MQHQNKPRPHARNPFAYENPWEMKPIRPMRAPRPTPRPQSDMGDAVKGVTDVAKIAVISGATIGILGAFQK